MSDLEISLIGVASAIGAVVIIAIVFGVVHHFFTQGGGPELSGIRKERRDNERSADRAALQASEQIASASSVGREVRHTRRDLTAQSRSEQHHRELDQLSGGGVLGGDAGGPPPPPPHP